MSDGRFGYKVLCPGFEHCSSLYLHKVSIPRTDNNVTLATRIYNYSDSSQWLSILALVLLTWQYIVDILTGNTCISSYLAGIKCARKYAPGHYRRRITWIIVFENISNYVYVNRWCIHEAVHQPWWKRYSEMDRHVSVTNIRKWSLVVVALVIFLY